MLQFLKDLMSEESKVSSMRFMAVLCCVTACFLSVYSVIYIKDATTLIGVLLGTAFTGKVAQKMTEGK
jgi:hypothetical protein